MHIIFGKDQAAELSKRYTVLELDTFQLGPQGQIITAYCVIESVSFGELATLADAQHQHQHLLINYRLRNWQDCVTGIEQLTGKWRGELDSFYQDLLNRVQTYLTQEPDLNWSHIIVK